jgi:hypothetical protein
MDRAKKARTPLRTALTRTIHDVNVELSQDAPDHDVLREKLNKLEDLEMKTTEFDTKVLDEMLDADADDDVYGAEHRAIEEYQDRIRVAKMKIHKILDGTVDPVEPTSSVVCLSTNGEKRRTYKLPTIEMKKFTGDLKEWLGWWAQFEKIHDDDELHPTDKFQYLLQATVEGSRARRLVDGYPQTADNYPKVIEALIDRYGDKVLLTELYVRQLARLVVMNASKNNSRSLSNMFDELESSLRALESLGVTAEQSAAFLYPLVESSLPEDIQKVWQRSTLAGYDEEGKDKAVDERLKSLMKFLKMEVKGAERLSFVNAGIGNNQSDRRRDRRETREDFPTAAGLHSAEVRKCLFCEKGHESKDCGKASTMTYEEKKSKMDQRKCCFACLRTGHGVKKCKTFVRCQICSKRHYVVVCPELASIRSSPQKSSNGESSSREEVKNLTAASSHGTVLLQTLRVKLHGPRGAKVVRALIDSGAQRSYILNSTAIDLGLSSTGTQQLAHAVFGGQVTERRSHNQHEVRIESVRGSNQLVLSLLGQERICNTLPRIPKGSWLNQLKKEGVFLTDLQPGSLEIEVLFGADACAHLFTGIIKKIQESIIAVDTKLGWTVMGRLENLEESVSCQVITSCLDVADVERLWSLDTLGIRDPAERLSNKEEEEEARQHFLQTVSRAEDGRYIVGLPWIDKQKRIPDNRTIAEKRLQSATNKLRIADKYHVYERIFLDWLKEGIIEIANEDSANCHYLPHRPVFKPESTTTPVRPVFDASCKHGRNPSLNDLLQKGPNLIELIPSILLRFRRHQVGVLSDIRKAFQMIDVKEEDRDYLRFLWWDNKGQVIKFRHRRVVFGINSSPFLLGAVLQYHLSNVNEDEKETARKLMTSIYVDNCVCSFKTFREYLDFRKKSVELLAQAKMELRQWECSAVEDSRVDLLSGSKCGLESGSGSSQEAENSTTNVLGLCWDKEGDFLTIVLPKEQSVSVNTKRELLSSVAKLFDPMGFVSPTTLVPKLLLQQTWIIKLGWDEEIPESVKYQFDQWKSELSSLRSVKIPRFAFDLCDNPDSYELHTFCDASKCAFAAVVFVRTENRGKVSVQLLMAKSRVAPKKASTIPRLELLGCVIGARLCHSVTEAFGKEKIRKFFWTDSTTALAWIRRNDEWGTFVGNRVKQINELTNAVEWRHIPGPSNPADLPSRGCSPTQLLKSRWWEGPSWLQDKEEDWPSITSSEDEDLIVSERRKTKVMMLTATSSHAWYVSRFSTYMKNIRVMAWIRRFVGRTRKQSDQVGQLTVEEIKFAEFHIMKLIQQEAFPTKGEVIGGIRVVRNEDGLICVNTKLTQRQDHRSFRLPVLLPSHHPLVEQLIRYYHSIWCHGGVQFLMGKLREKFWVMKARSVIKSVISKCVKCRRFSTKSPCLPPAPLPKDRVTSGSTFQVSGVDLAGPLFLKNGTKVWVVLFTCAVYRCVHLEMVGSLTTEAFLLALQKFVCRRGRPDTIWSDNGTNFRGAVNAFKLLDWKRIEEETTIKMIKWKFIPPTAAWWGGWWERLIRTIKDMLKKMLGHSKLSWSQLESLLCDVERSMNERPLTYVSDDQDDLVPLTPSMFLYGPRMSSFPESEVFDAIGLRKAAASMNVLRGELLSRFRKEYLAHLVHRGKMEKQNKIQVGDVVLVGSDQKKRLFWPMGLVVELLPGADGHFRVAKVRVREGILLRPIQRLFPLEISSKSEVFPVSAEVIQKSKKPSELIQEQNQVTRAGRRVKKPQRYGSAS